MCHLIYTDTFYMKRKWIRWVSWILLTPIILFVILMVLLYVPPVQNLLRREVTAYASKATGMQIQVERIDLRFPLNLLVRGVEVIQQPDTLLSLESLNVRVQAWPLIKGKVEVDEVTLSRVAVNSADLMEGMNIKGVLGRFFLQSHGVDLSNELAVINQVELSDTHVQLLMNDTTTTPKDTTASAPINWKVALHQLKLKNVSFSMPLLAMVLAAIYLKEPITGKKVLGIAVGATGALLLILGSHQVSEAKAAGNHYIWGDLLVLLAQFSYALYFVLFKNFVNKYSLITIMKWMFTYAFICALPFSYNDLLHTEWKSLQNTEIGALVFIVVGSTFISYVLIVIGQKNLRPTVAGMYNYVQPLVASIVAVCWGMDTFNFVKIISVALIFGGVYLVTNSRSKAEMEAVVADKN